ncbi:MAG: hypothetical protein O7A08_05790 [SAR324 cluster bacterium]|nr:hypothetical protein [SAR324 cluster bacterium]
MTDQVETPAPEKEAPPAEELELEIGRKGFFSKFNILRMFRKESPKMYVNEGQKLIENHNLALATIAFQKALSLDQENKEAYKGLGNVFMRKGGRSNSNLALENFQAASRIDPFDEHVYALSARLYEKLQMMKEATLERKKMMIVKTLQTEPNNSIANNNMGILLLQQNNAQSAITYFQKSIAAKASYDVAHRNMSATYLRMATAEQDEEKKKSLLSQAKASIGKALEINRSTSSLLIDGKILICEGLFDDALTIVEEVEKMDPTNKDVFSFKRTVLEKLRRTKDAQEAYDSYQALADQTPDG